MIKNLLNWVTLQDGSTTVFHIFGSFLRRRQKPFLMDSNGKKSQHLHVKDENTKFITR